ncbi:hypothetical protein [Methylosinus sp. Sm6]|uniref:hypothetical protein n=1 Tax=Methylosinus sp. Sm6 TaxID=2866948 RepID=UPI001C99A7F8|nr:hypothetical protein [Methylosinus sp. Sm6]MBY6240319.1 hypothetical protein [Methylosinus sp. Sm6]
MAEARPRPRRSWGARAILAAFCIIVLQLLPSAVGVGSAALGEPGVFVAHPLCVAAAGDDGAPVGPPAGPDDCGSCLFCQRGPMPLGIALPPLDSPAPAVAVTRDARPFRAFVPPSERRAGRGAGSSRAPPHAAISPAA